LLGQRGDLLARRPCDRGRQRPRQRFTRSKGSARRPCRGTRRPRAGHRIHIAAEYESIAIAEGLGDLVSALREAESEHKLDVYRNLGLSLTYDPETRTVRADIDLATHRRDLVRVRRSTRTNTPLMPILDLDLSLN
jgi:hypothetical protein